MRGARITTNADDGKRRACQSNKDTAVESKDAEETKEEFCNGVAGSGDAVTTLDGAGVALAGGPRGCSPLSSTDGGCPTNRRERWETASKTVGVGLSRDSTYGDDSSSSDSKNGGEFHLFVGDSAARKGDVERGVQPGKDSDRSVHNFIAGGPGIFVRCHT